MRRWSLNGSCRALLALRPRLSSTTCFIASGFPLNRSSTWCFDLTWHGDRASGTLGVTGPRHTDKRRARLPTAFVVGNDDRATAGKCRSSHRPEHLAATQRCGRDSHKHLYWGYLQAQSPGRRDPDPLLGADLWGNANFPLPSTVLCWFEWSYSRSCAQGIVNVVLSWLSRRTAVQSVT